MATTTEKIYILRVVPLLLQVYGIRRDNMHCMSLKETLKQHKKKDILSQLERFYCTSVFYCRPKLA